MSFKWKATSVAVALLFASSLFATISHAHRTRYRHKHKPRRRPGPVIVVPVPAPAPALTSWKQVGYTLSLKESPTVDRRMDGIHYMNIYNCGISKMRLRAINHPASIGQVKVYFRYAKPEFVRGFNAYIPAGTVSRSFDLDGWLNAGRCVTGVEVIGHGVTHPRVRPPSKLKVEARIRR